MEKTVLFVFFWMVLSTSVCAQTLQEWFQQKETQKDYLVQQIAALEAYAGTLRQGYDVLRQGINTVQHIKQGDLSLHQVFFYSLKQVNPAIGQSPILTDILTWQAAILQAFNTWLPSLRQEGQLTVTELQYLDQVKAQVWKTATRDIDALSVLLTSGTLELKDDERLAQLATLHQRMLEQYQFTSSFIKEVRMLSHQRAQGKKELLSIQSIYGFPQ